MKREAWVEEGIELFEKRQAASGAEIGSVEQREAVVPFWRWYRNNVEKVMRLVQIHG